jgi:hypothetical protein
MLNGHNWSFGLVLPNPEHRFPAARQVQPKIPIGFPGRFSGVVLASLCFGLEKITRFHCSTKQKRPVRGRPYTTETLMACICSRTKKEGRSS